MLAKRFVVLLTLSALCVFPLFGCSPQADGVDKPLTKTDQPIPPKPDKPELSPSGGGGAAPK